MGLDVGVVTFEYLPQPQPPVYDFLYGLLLDPYTDIDEEYDDLWLLPPPPLTPQRQYHRYRYQHAERHQHEGFAVGFRVRPPASPPAPARTRRTPRWWSLACP